MSGVEEDEEEDEEEVFYESRDRVLSSSCSSTSASDDDQGGGADHAHRPRHPPPAVDVWTSEPAPVQERRRRLLHMMGLNGDPSSLARLEMGRSVSYDGPIPTAAASPMPRSRSDGAAPAPAPPTKPPLGARSRSRRTSSGSSEAIDDPRCLIRNLDDGTEFVVREEFGLRELGTGRHLTMEQFELCVGRSPIVQELMRRHDIEMSASNSNNGGASTPPIQRSSSDSSNGATATRNRRRSNWLRTIRDVAGSMLAASRDRRSSDERDTSSEKAAGRRSSSATDDSQDSAGAVHCSPEPVKVRHYGKSYKELSGLFMNQEIQAHGGSIWSIKFSPDGRYLASAGEDCVIHVWEVLEFDRRREENGVCNPFVAVMCDGSPEPTLALATMDGSHWGKKRRARVSQSWKSMSSDRLMLPEHVVGLSEKPFRTFEGHSEDVLDLCWSKSQYLLSSSMDKTVKLWHMSSVSCLKTFSHCDYVTCIQFNPVDDRYFISGSLDEKVRIWSIPKREIVDWHDLHEMVTAACYSPDGQSALVGSHKGSCHIYDTSDSKLLQRKQIDLQTKKKKSSQKKITGFQFFPGSSSKVLITSADSRIRVVDGVELVHKFKGFRNTDSQISACLAAKGRYVISASEDSHVYMWRNEDSSEQRRRSKGAVSVTNSYEHFYCQDVMVAAALPSTAGSAVTSRTNSGKQEELDHLLHAGPDRPRDSSDFQQHQSGIDLNTGSNHSGDIASATWPEELMTPTKQSPRSSCTSTPNGAAVQAPSRSAWGMAIVTAGSGGQIRILQNFGFPVRV